jgi:hypothetical protein
MRTGILFYPDMLAPLRELSEESLGRLVLAALDYAATGEEPAFTGEEGLAWLFLRPAVDRDEARYEQKCEKARRAARARWDRAASMRTHADDANSNSNDNSSSNSNDNPNDNDNSNDNSNSNSNCVCERAREARVPPTQAASRDTHTDEKSGTDFDRETKRDSEEAGGSPGDGRKGAGEGAACGRRRSAFTGTGSTVRVVGNGLDRSGDPDGVRQAEGGGPCRASSFLPGRRAARDGPGVIGGLSVPPGADSFRSCGKSRKKGTPKGRALHKAALPFGIPSSEICGPRAP